MRLHRCSLTSFRLECGARDGQIRQSFLRTRSISGILSGQAIASFLSTISCRLVRSTRTETTSEPGPSARDPLPAYVRLIDSPGRKPELAKRYSPRKERLLLGSGGT